MDDCKQDVDFLIFPRSRIISSTDWTLAHCAVLLQLEHLTREYRTCRENMSVIQERYVLTYHHVQ
eukprot:4844075-Pyramimonas_sp.AAC.2